MAVKWNYSARYLEGDFLSRLCGGEVVVGDTLLDETFLSRLCGGEAVFLTWGVVFLFLSRLCGGEGQKC